MHESGPGAAARAIRHLEMSFGLTGHNEHHGQVRNPYGNAHLTGGFSCGAGAAVAVRIVLAALGGDTVGSIRVPASLCGVVGCKPTPGRWPSEGVAPVSGTLDTTGLLARSVEDCDLVDAVLTERPVQSSNPTADLRGVSFAYAPRQHLLGVGGQAESAFREALRRLEDAGAELVEVDLGGDFPALSARTTWPILFHETLPAVRDFLVTNEVLVSFEQLHADLSEYIEAIGSRAVVPSAPGYVSDEKYLAALKPIPSCDVDRHHRVMESPGPDLYACIASRCSGRPLRSRRSSVSPPPRFALSDRVPGPGGSIQ